MTKISVVVPFYNAQPFLARCLEGLLDQSLPHDRYEIVAIDNNSTDGSIETARSFSGITVLSQPTQGSYAARNMGIARARHDVLAFIDPDCKPSHRWLEAVLTAMASESCALVLGRRHYRRSVPLDLLSAYEAEKLMFVLSHGNEELFYGYTNNMAVRRTVFERVGVFAERIRGGDTIFVRSVVDEFGCAAVRYQPDMEIDHLEIQTLADYYRKRHVYGGSNERIRQTVRFRPLGNRERVTIFLRMVRARRVGPAQALLLLGLLIPGAVIYDWGRTRAQRTGTSAARAIWIA